VAAVGEPVRDLRLIGEDPVLLLRVVTEQLAVEERRGSGERERDDGLEDIEALRRVLELGRPLPRGEPVLLLSFVAVAHRIPGRAGSLEREGVDPAPHPPTDLAKLDGEQTRVVQVQQRGVARPDDDRRVVVHR
jgi:hypothetical protein